MAKNDVTGMQVYYYYVCKRKLWYFSNELTMESENENVKIGKIIDETSYKNKKKHIMINNTINIDYISEVFKPLIADRLIFSLLNRNQITEDSFVKDLNGLQLTEKVSKTIMAELDNKLKTTIFHKELNKNVSY